MTTAPQPSRAEPRWRFEGDWPLKLFHGDRLILRAYNLSDAGEAAILAALNNHEPLLAACEHAKNQFYIARMDSGARMLEEAIAAAETKA